MASPVTAAKITIMLSRPSGWKRIACVICVILFMLYFFCCVLPMQAVSAIFLKFLPDLDRPDEDVFVLAVEKLKSGKSISNSISVTALKAIDFTMDGQFMAGTDEAGRFIEKHFIKSHTEEYTVTVESDEPDAPPHTETRTRTVYEFLTSAEILEKLADEPFTFIPQDITLISAMLTMDNEAEEKPDISDTDGLPLGGGIYSIVGQGARLSRGWHDRGISSGIDIAAATGTPCYAMFDGTVRYYLWKDSSGALVGYGAVAYLDSEDGRYRAIYGHLSQFQNEQSRILIASLATKRIYMPTRQELQYSARVKKGDIIGRVGNTGYSFGSHLHFGLHIDGVAVNPQLYL